MLTNWLIFVSLVKFRDAKECQLSSDCKDLQNDCKFKWIKKLALIFLRDSLLSNVRQKFLVRCQNEHNAYICLLNMHYMWDCGVYLPFHGCNLTGLGIVPDWTLVATDPQCDRDSLFRNYVYSSPWVTTLLSIDPCNIETQFKRSADRKTCLIKHFVVIH